MPIERRIVTNGITFFAPFYMELCEGQSKEGILPKDPEAHALWNYFLVASNSFRMMKENYTLEGDPSHLFASERVFLAIAKQHQVDPNKMIRYWPIVLRQRSALGLGSDDDFPLMWRLTEITAN